MLKSKFLRIEQGHSQRGLCRLTRNAVKQSELSLIESGRLTPTDRQLQALARALGATPPEVLLEQVCAGPLGDGAEFRDAHRNRLDTE